jgi:hypothetical protein
MMVSGKASNTCPESHLARPSNPSGKTFRVDSEMASKTPLDHDRNGEDRQAYWTREAVPRQRPAVPTVTGIHSTDSRPSGTIHGGNGNSSQSRSLPNLDCDEGYFPRDIGYIIAKKENRKRLKLRYFQY